MKWLLPLLAIAVADPAPSVPVFVAYALHQASKTQLPQPPKPHPQGCVSGCKCDNGLITHGDGHNTRCKCPKTCPCQKGFPD